MTDEQFAAWAQMNDLSAEEQALMLQQKQADQLRTSGMQPSHRLDFGSQAARAMQGLGGGLADRQYQQNFDAYKQHKQDNAGLVRDILFPKPKQPDVTPLGIPSNRGPGANAFSPDESYGPE